MNRVDHKILNQTDKKWSVFSLVFSVQLGSVKNYVVKHVGVKSTRISAFAEKCFLVDRVEHLKLNQPIAELPLLLRFLCATRLSAVMGTK